MAKNKDINKNTLNFIQKWFNIKVNKNATETSRIVAPSDTTEKEGGELKYIDSDLFTPQIQRLYDYWITTYFDKEKYQERQNLWSEMENLYFNDSICSRNVNIRADETVQADSNMQPIFAEGNKKQVDFILKFFDDVQVYNKIRNISFDLEVFGNHVWVFGINGEKGIDEIIPVDIFSLTERLEFFPAEIEAKLMSNSFYKNYASQDRVKQLIDAISNKDNVTSVHKKYLLGFIINNYILPPWRVLHFRNETTRSPFAPFGVPGIIHELAPYKQWDASMTFQVMARAANFPIDKYSINLPNVMDDTEKFNLLANFIEKLDNIGIRQSKKDDKNLGDRIFTITDLFDYDQISPDIDIGKIADIDMLRDERIVASGLPRNIIDPNDGSFGDSGVSLIQKWKELARSVFHRQHTILENLTQMVKLQMILTNSFSIDEFDFVLSMPFPESQTDDNLIRNQSDTLDLFVTLTDTLSDKFMDGEPLPIDLMRDIMYQVIPYDQRRIDSWIDQIEKAQKEDEKETDEFETEETSLGFGKKDGEEEIVDKEDDFNFESKQKEKKKRFNENLKKHKIKFSEAVKVELFNIRQKSYREGIYNNKHYFSSRNKNSDFEAETLRKIDKRIVEAMNENYIIPDDSIIETKKEDSTDE
jgi:hypothetical protein